MRLAIPPLLAALLAACSPAPAAEQTSFREIAGTLGASAPASVSAVSDAEVVRICRAAVAALFGRDVAIMQVEQVQLGAADIRYLRPDDGSVWRNRCRLNGNVVEWAGIDVYGPGTGLGRWRTDPADGHVTYATDGDRIAITQLHFDGSTSRDEFTVAR